MPWKSGSETMRGPFFMVIEPSTLLSSKNNGGSNFGHEATDGNTFCTKHTLTNTGEINRHSRGKKPIQLCNIPSLVLSWIVRIAAADPANPFLRPLDCNIAWLRYGLKSAQQHVGLTHCLLGLDHFKALPRICNQPCTSWKFMATSVTCSTWTCQTAHSLPQSFWSIRKWPGISCITKMFRNSF